MKQFIAISSKGEVEEKAFTLLGASSKRDDITKIGQWGSGLKYSIAYLLRNKIEFKVFSGYREIKFSTAIDSFRGQQVEVICVNGQSTSMTTEMGFDWEPWFVLREIICNAMDEGYCNVEESVTDTVPVEDHTIFYICQNQDFVKVFGSWNEYFAEKRKDVLYTTEKGDILYQGSDRNIIYRKSIVCHNTSGKSLFHYNLQNAEINESRVLKSIWYTQQDMRTLLCSLTDVEIIKYILTNVIDSTEEEFYWHTGKYSEQWLEAIGNKILIPHESSGFWSEQYNPQIHLIVPNRIVEGLKNQFKDKIRVIGGNDGHDFKLVEPTEIESLKVEKALEFLKKANYEISHKINVAVFENSAILGRALNDEIIISRRVIGQGLHDIAMTIIEENEHCKTKHGDFTRAFQNQLIKLFLNELEIKTQTVL